MKPPHVYIGISALLAMLTVSCAVGPNFETPEAPKVESYTQDALPAETATADIAGGAAQKFLQSKDVPASWWEEFHSEPLNKLVEQGLKKNPDIIAAKATLKQARENYYAETGSLLPSVDLNGGVTREKFSGAAFGQPNLPSSIFTLYSGSLSVSYGLDLFGGERRAIESLEAQTDYERYQLEAAYLTLTNNIVATAIQEASLREQIRQTEEIIDIEKKQLDVLQKQFDVGGISKIPIVGQQSTLATAEASLPGLQKQYAQAHNQLAILVGEFPSEKLDESFELAKLTLPEELPVSLPSKLIKQRPDIKAAEAQLHSASAEIGVATANMLPQISLTGSYGYENTKTSNLFDSASNVWSLGAGLVQPIFHGGELLHEKRASVAAYKKAAAEYQSTVLTAFKNVADSLQALQFDSTGLQAQVNAANATANNLNLVQSQFKEGSVNYISLLDAQHDYLQAKVNLVQAQAQRYADTAALYQSLGGGWNNKETATEEPAAQVPATQPDDNKTETKVEKKDD